MKKHSNSDGASASVSVGVGGTFKPQQSNVYMPTPLNTGIPFIDSFKPTTTGSGVLLPKTTTNMSGGAIKTANGSIINTVAESYPYKLTTPMMHGEGIKNVQKALNAKINAGLEVHGIFGSATKAALINFQKSKGLGADGVYGNCSRFHLEGIGSCSSGGGSTAPVANASVSSGTTTETASTENPFAQFDSGSGGAAAPRPTIFGMPQELFWGLGLGVFLVIGFLMATKYRVFEANKIVL